MRVALMWEARAVEGRGAELLGWVREQRLADDPIRFELLTAPGDRVLAMSWWDVPGEPGEPSGSERPSTTRVTLPQLPDPPAGLLARPVHRWRFNCVDPIEGAV